MIQRLSLPVFLCLTLFVLMPLAHTQGQKRKKNKDKDRVVLPTPKEKEPSKSKIMRAEEALVEGMKFFMLEEYDKAVKHFEKSLELDPNNGAAQFQIARAQKRENKPAAALSAAEKALELDPQNPFYYVFLGQFYRQLRKIPEAIETYERLVQDVEQKPEYYEELAMLYLQNQEHRKAISTYDKIEERYGTSIEVVRRRQLIYLQQDDLERAIKEGEKLIATFPNVEPYIIQQAEILLRLQRKEEAKALLNELLLESDEFPQAYLLLAQIHQSEGNTEAQNTALEAAFSSPALNLDAKIDILMRYYQNMALDVSYQQAGLQLSKLTLEAHPQAAEPYSMLGDFQLAGGDFAEARKNYISALERNPDNYDLWERVIQLDLNEQDYQAAVAHSESALEYFPNQAMLWYYSGSANYLQKAYQEAVAALEQGLMLATDKRLKSQFSSQLGDVYHALKSFQKSDKAYEEALSYDPNNAHAMNNYSYFLSLREEKLGRAKELSAKLVERYPENATYLDTHGWVLYQRGEYGQAAAFLQKAVEGAPNDGTVLEHYADVLFRLRKKEEAIRLWKRAKELGGDLSPDIDRKIQRGEL